MLLSGQRGGVCRRGDGVRATRAATLTLCTAIPFGHLSTLLSPRRPTTSATRRHSGPSITPLGPKPLTTHTPGRTSRTTGRPATRTASPPSSPAPAHLRRRARRPPAAAGVRRRPRRAARRPPRSPSAAPPSASPVPPHHRHAARTKHRAALAVPQRPSVQVVHEARAVDGVRAPGRCCRVVAPVLVRAGRVHNVRQGRSVGGVGAHRPHCALDRREDAVVGYVAAARIVQKRLSANACAQDDRRRRVRRAVGKHEGRAARRPSLQADHADTLHDVDPSARDVRVREGLSDHRRVDVRAQGRVEGHVVSIRAHGRFESALRRQQLDAVPAPAGPGAGAQLGRDGCEEVSPPHSTSPQS